MTNPETKSNIPDSVTLDEFYLIKGALHDPNWQFRTVSGIHLDTGIDPVAIEDTLKSTEIARSPIYTTRQNVEVFAPKDQPKTVREVVAEVLWIIER
jgi:hypothetical protein